MTVVLGIDCSSQSCTVEVRDVEDGTLLGSGHAPHPKTTPPRSEQWPQDWWQALSIALKQAGKHDIAAIAVDGQSHGLVLLDEAGTVLRPAKLWNDTESSPEAKALVEQYGARFWSEQCGCVPTSAFTITKLLWVLHHEPENLHKAAHILLPHDWMTHRLTGAYATDRGEASTTGYFGIVDGVWRQDLLALVDPDIDWLRRLPTILPPEGLAGEVSRAIASELGITPGAFVTAGTGDQMAGALGLGLDVGEVALSIGTSGTIYSVCDHPIVDETGAIDSYADATGRFLPLVCTLNAAKVLDTAVRLLGVDYADFDNLALAGTKCTVREMSLAWKPAYVHAADPVLRADEAGTRRAQYRARASEIAASFLR